MRIRPTSPTRPITPDPALNKHHFRSGMWQKLHHLFNRDHPPSPSEGDHDFVWSGPNPPPPANKDGPVRPVGVGLPRQTTFKRQNSERRDRLLPIPTEVAERRAVSASRHASISRGRRRSKSSSHPHPSHRSSAPPASGPDFASGVYRSVTDAEPCAEPLEAVLDDAVFDHQEPRPPRPPSQTSSRDPLEGQRHDVDHRTQLDTELDTRWILNLSMHFRDKSDREKFFVTYAESPSKWRRVTVSCDYRNAEPGSLEMDLKELPFQRDKSLQIYEAIRESLLEIQFYETVTNLKLETSDGRLHVHVTEDVNEIIPYPPASGVRHITEDDERAPLMVRERDLSFESHLSGFVYKVKLHGRTYIKKEIPGPDTVDEFLYELNALHALGDSATVIRLEGIVLDDNSQIVKGILVGYAERGAVVDLLYDHRGHIPWESRARWARDAVAGLRDIHGEGYVQGDLTLSNIVVDGHDHAKIIDINRRGCPVGWEPPEIAKKIASNQRISMYIGEKTDLYQLGMTLWALAMDDDEPERHAVPLSVDVFPSDIPAWYQQVVRVCLAPRPRDRLPARELLKMFPAGGHGPAWHRPRSQPSLAVRTEKRYIDPAAAVERDDLERFHKHERFDEEMLYSPESSRDDYTFTYPKSSDYDLDRDSDASDAVDVSDSDDPPRGRRPPSQIDHLTRAERIRRGYPLDEERDSSACSDPNLVTVSPPHDELDLDVDDFQLDETLVEPETAPERLGVWGRAPATAGQVRSAETGALRRRRLGPRDGSANSASTPRNSELQLTATTTSGVSHWSQSPEALPADADRTESLGEPCATGGPRRAIPRLPFSDSGYDEPLDYFGLVLQEQNRKLSQEDPDTERLLPYSPDGKPGTLPHHETAAGYANPVTSEATAVTREAR